MRHLISDISKAGTIGYEPTIDVAAGIQRYLGWIRSQGDVRDYFAEAERNLKTKRIVHSVRD